MTDTHSLHGMLGRSARECPDQNAVEDLHGAAITYRDLDALSDRVRDRLVAWGLRPGDRVGFSLHKSIDSVAVLFGILKTGAAYVPVDATAPSARNAYVFNDCSVGAIVVEERLSEELRSEMSRLGRVPPFLSLHGVGGGAPLASALSGEDEGKAAPTASTHPSSPDDMAYILYTSGSTGMPKGVPLTHQNASSFVHWCSEVFAPGESDRFSSHAPFHFDLSILDLYVPVKHGATLVLIDEEIGKNPARLAPLVSEKKISIWYSTPSILALLYQYGKLEEHDYSALRWVLFAGEVFPIKHLRALKQLWPGARYMNLYGPTETNVCTYYEIPKVIPEERRDPYPIGKVCSHLRTKVVDPQGKTVRPGDEGELCVNGVAVMKGYWNLPEESAAVFLSDDAGDRWYKTGDIVVEESDGNYTFLGRRDRMVKRRGYRVELGEIEAGLYRHESIEEAAVVALPDRESGVRIRAFITAREGETLSIIALKKFCAENLPSYMIPDVFSFSEALPRTSTNKVDYQRLKETE